MKLSVLLPQLSRRFDDERIPPSVYGEFTPSQIRQCLEDCRVKIEKGSKSFALASKFLPQKSKQYAIGLYAWCRHCDDLIDGSVLGHAQKELKADSPPIAMLKKLKEDLLDTYEGKIALNSPDIALWAAAYHNRIPYYYPDELLNGMEMDVAGQRYETIKDLEHYCYRVAGVVGLMMAHIMGVSDEKALKNAAHMGIAMQLTNIARDVSEDAENNRLYLPLSWLRLKNLTQENFLENENKNKTFDLVVRLLKRAYEHYELGQQGYRYLSASHAFSIGMAQRVYSAIGDRILSLGPRYFEKRTVVTLPEKFNAMSWGFLTSLKANRTFFGSSFKSIDKYPLFRFEDLG